MKPEAKFSSTCLPYVTAPDQLRVGIVLDSPVQSLWAAKILSRIKFSSFAALSLIIHFDLPEKQSGHANAPQGNSRLWDFIHAVDERRHGKYVGSRQPRDVRDIIASLPSVRIEPGNGAGGYLTQEVLGKIQAANLDVILYFGDQPVPTQLLKMARCGVWPYFRRFIHWQAPSTALDYLLKLYEFGPQAFAGDPYLATFDPRTLDNLDRQTVKDAWRFIWKAGKQYFLDNVYEHTHADRFELAFQLDHAPDLSDLKFQPQHRLVPPIHKIYGDPFPVKVGGRFFLFFEEMFALSDDLTGTISYVEIDPVSGKMSRIKPALKRNYHLSYPMIFDWAGDYFMIPESGQNSCIELFRASHFPDRWEFVKTLVPDVLARDTTIFQHEGKFWLFTNFSEKNPEIENYVSDQLFYSLHIYSADTPLGPWTKHPQNPVKMDSSNTRSAGHIFRWNGEWIRPTQDCSPRYGYAVIFNRVDELTADTYRETEIGKLLPPRMRGMLGVHTFNHCHGLSVIDLNRYRGLFA